LTSRLYRKRSNSACGHGVGCSLVPCVLICSTVQITLDKIVKGEGTPTYDVVCLKQKVEHYGS